MNFDNFINSLRNSISEVTVSEVFQKMNSEKIKLIDVREEDEVENGYPKGAMTISKGLLEIKLGQLNLDINDEIYLICGSGVRSLIAANSLHQIGFQNVHSVKGGFKDWKFHNLPVETSAKLAESEIQKYKRQIILPEVGKEGQLKLKKFRILVVGAGGIGSPCLLYLTAAGIGTIGIIDNDVIDATNLQRQILYSEQEIGKRKVEEAKNKLQQLNSLINYKVYNEILTAENIDEIFPDYDLIIDGTDNFATRYLVNDACLKHKIPNVHGSVFQFEGQFSTFNPTKNEDYPCYRCLYPEPPPMDISPSCQEAGVLGILPGIIGLFCATESIKIALEMKGTMEGKLLQFDAKKWDFNMLKIPKNKNCTHCNAAKIEYEDYSNYNLMC